MIYTHMLSSLAAGTRSPLESLPNFSARKLLRRCMLLLEFWNTRRPPPSPLRGIAGGIQFGERPQGSSVQQLTTDLVSGPGEPSKDVRRRPLMSIDIQQAAEEAVF
jgi:hypothetical protein